MAYNATPQIPSRNLFDLTGLNAVISGATRGIGLACVKALLESGASVCLLIRPSSKPPPLEKSFEDQKITSYPCDLTTLNASTADEVITGAESQLEGPIGILINCGGIQRRSPAVDFPENDWNEVIQVNLSSAFFLSQAAARSMIPRHRGKIINFCSLMTFQGGITVPAYAAAKGGLGQLTKALSNEWAKEGIQVNGVCPGYVATEMIEALVKDPSRANSIAERIPAGRWGEPIDFAGPIVFLSSAASMYVNGELLVVDGGWMGR